MWAVPNKVIFCSSMMLITPGIFSMCFRSPFLMSPRAPTTTGIVSVFIPHILVVSISWSLYLESFSVDFNEVFLSDGIFISMSLQVLLLCSFVLLLLLLLLLIIIIIIIVIIINNGNRTEWSPIRSVIIRVINKIGRPRSGSPIC